MTPELARARKAVDALRIPDAAFKACPNTVRQSLADIIERLLAELKLRRDVINELEAERDTLEKRCDGLRSTLFDADAELAGAREEAILECAAIARDFVPNYADSETPWSIEDAILALLPTTEPEEEKP